MPTYDVRFTRDVVQYQGVYIVASSEQEARRKARPQLEDDACEECLGPDSDVDYASVEVVEY